MVSTPVKWWTYISAIVAKGRNLQVVPKILWEEHHVPLLSQAWLDPHKPGTRWAAVSASWPQGWWLHPADGGVAIWSFPQALMRKLDITRKGTERNNSQAVLNYRDGQCFGTRGGAAGGWAQQSCLNLDWKIKPLDHRKLKGGLFFFTSSVCWCLQQAQMIMGSELLSERNSIKYRGRRGECEIMEMQHWNIMEIGGYLQ